jgi:hypothetical protein
MELSKFPYTTISILLMLEYADDTRVERSIELKRKARRPSTFDGHCFSTNEREFLVKVALRNLTPEEYALRIKFNSIDDYLNRIADFGTRGTPKERAIVLLVKKKFK